MARQPDAIVIRAFRPAISMRLKKVSMRVTQARTARRTVNPAAYLNFTRK